VRLIFIHGPAAVGKFTVAKELAALTGFELYHNHLVVDAVLQQHAFGTPGFVAERDRQWREYFGRYPGPGRPDIIFTFNPEKTVPQEFIDWLFAALPRRGVALAAVELTAGEATILQRLGAASRRDFRKLSDPDLYRRLRAAGDFDLPVLPRADLLIDTGQTTPPDAARQIARHFGLG
jgi:hypothetical protein